MTSNNPTKREKWKVRDEYGRSAEILESDLVRWLERRSCNIHGVYGFFTSFAGCRMCVAQFPEEERKEIVDRLEELYKSGIKFNPHA